MSPEVSIKPSCLRVRLRRVELVADVILAKCSNSESDGVSDCRVKLGSEAFQFLVSGTINPNTRTMHANQHTSAAWRLASLVIIERAGWADMRRVGGAEIVTMGGLHRVSPSPRKQARFLGADDSSIFAHIQQAL